MHDVLHLYKSFSCKFLLHLSEDDLDRALETAVEKGMLGDLYDIITHTSDGALCKVIQILAELGKTGIKFELSKRFIRQLIFQGILQILTARGLVQVSFRICMASFVLILSDGVMIKSGRISIDYRACF